MSLTKKAISDAFLKLSKQKNIDKITVKDIVDECSITRQTFYYHYKDIIDVVEWSLEQKMNEILERSLKADSAVGAIRILISAVEENPEIIKKLMDSQKREYIEKIIFDSMKSYLQEMIVRKELFMDMTRSDMEMALNFYSYAIVGTMLDINYKRRPVDLDMISKQIHSLITGEMFKKK